MSEHIYHATVTWSRQPQEIFTDNKFSRAHQWQFDEGTIVPASASPFVLPPPLSRLDAVDPEEALIASLASCHMLFFLYRVARAGFVIEHYEDLPEAVMGKTPEGSTFIAKITLQPKVTWSGNPPTEAQLTEWHDKAHHDCYIANTLKSEMLLKPRP